MSPVSVELFPGAFINCEFSSVGRMAEKFFFAFYQDRSKCRCIQMTVEATSWSSGGRDEEAGYKFRRLQEPLLTGFVLI